MNRCDQCGAAFDYAPDLCPLCGAYGRILPRVPIVEIAPPMLSVDARDIPADASKRHATGFKPWDIALCGGLVVGQSLIVYGPAGARKTTWMGAIADHIAGRARRRALYLASEIPGPQVREAVERIRPPRALLIVGSERNACNLMACIEEIARVRPLCVVYDSIQAFDAAGALAGSELALTSTVKLSRRAAATMRHIAILICQVNKAGAPAGPYRSIHDCDTVVRIAEDTIAVKKNRYGVLPPEPVSLV